MNNKKPIVLQTHRNFRLRLVLATLARQPVRIEKIRVDHTDVGIREHEVSFLRMLESLTNGSVIEVSLSGTTITYRPGIIIGGSVTLKCHESRAIGYYLEYLLLLAPFAKKKFSIVFQGVDADSVGSIGLEGVKWGLLPIMEKFGVRDVELHILKRGAPPKGGSEAHLIVNQLLTTPLTIHAIEQVKISSIRGVAYSTRVSPSVVNRIVESCRQVFQDTGCKTDIVADAWRGENSGKSPGWGVTLVAESKKGWRYFVEEVGGAGLVPEDVGHKAALELLQEIRLSGVLCRQQMAFALSFMLLGRENIGRLVLKKDQIDEQFVHVLRDVKQLLGVEVYFKGCSDYMDDAEDSVVMMVKGMGFINANKKIA